MAGLLRLLPRLIKTVGPTLIKNLPKLTKPLAVALVSIGLGSLVSGSLGGHVQVDHDLNEFPPLEDFPSIPSNTFPRPSKNSEPWVKGPKKQERPPRLPPGHYYDPVSGGPIKPGPDVPPEPYTGPRPPPNSPRSSDGSGDPGDDPLGPPGDPWGGDDDEDREPEPGNPRPRKKWPPDWPQSDPYDDEHYEKWRSWIRLFRVWRHDINQTYQEIVQKATGAVQPIITPLLSPTISEIINKPKKPYPLAEFAKDINTNWYNKLKSGYLLIRDESWAKPIVDNFKAELHTLSGLNEGLIEIGQIILEKKKQGWVSLDYPGDPADVTQTQKAAAFYDAVHKA